jgi:uroporphyrinogen III methyltransferase/synthase
LILTSANAVTYFMQRLFALGRDLRSLAHLKIAVVGSKTAVTLREFGINADFIPPEFVADSLVAHFPENLLGLKVLFPRVETGGREVLVQEMHRAGAIVTEVAAYQSHCPEQMPEAVLQALQQEQIDVITFTSSKGVQHFWQILQQSGVTGNMGDKKQELLLSTPSITLDFSGDKYLPRSLIAAIGPQTAKSCRTILGRVDLEAQEYTLEGLTKSLITWGSSINVK